MNLIVEPFDVVQETAVRLTWGRAFPTVVWTAEFLRPDGTESRAGTFRRYAEVSTGPTKAEVATPGNRGWKIGDRRWEMGDGSALKS